MNISTNEFQSIYYCSKKIESNITEDYDLHLIVVFNTIKVDKIKLEAFYDTSSEYYKNDFNLPQNFLKLNRITTDKVLLIINDIKKSDFNNKKLIFKTLEKVKELCSAIDSIEKLKEVYCALKNNIPDVANFLPTDKEYIKEKLI